jgi:cytochrome P450
MGEGTLVFDPFSEEFVRNPHEMFRRLREEAPVYYNAELDFYAFTRYDDVAAAFKDHKTYSSTCGIDLAMVKSDKPPPKIILFMDPPEHRRMRSLVSKAFTSRAVRSLRDTVIDLVQKHLSNADPRRFDVMDDFCGPFPVDVITRMLGVPEERSQQVRTWFDTGMGQEPGRIEKSESAVQALAEAAGYFSELVQERRAQLQDDMISTLITAEVERANDQDSCLEDHEIVLFAMMLAAAGTETVTKLIGSAVAAGAKHPDQWQKLFDDRSKIPAAVNEALRYDGPVLYNVRSTTKDVIVGGVAIPADKPVLLCLASANRDHAIFAAADTFDVDRDWGRAQHLGFGGGIHSCLGASLARMETAIALEHLLDFMPRYEVIWQDAKRVTPTSVTGWQHLPVRVLQ